MNQSPEKVGIAFRERIAWLSLTAMVLAYSVYFALAARAIQQGAGTGELIGLLAAVLVVQILVVIAASIAIAICSGREARAPADERDRAIARRGAAAAYFVLMIGMIMVGCVMPFRDKGWTVINAALFALVVAEVVRYATIVTSYRRGWHG
ncbi:MAG: hypothetical protein ACJ8JD_11675 [Chthoniobacterales bacterium]|jgi:hypothetical protein